MDIATEMVLMFPCSPIRNYDRLFIRIQREISKKLTILYPKLETYLCKRNEKDSRCT